MRGTHPSRSLTPPFGATSAVVCHAGSLASPHPAMLGVAGLKVQWSGRSGSSLVQAVTSALHGSKIAQLRIYCSSDQSPAQIASVVGPALGPQKALFSLTPTLSPPPVCILDSDPKPLGSVYKWDIADAGYSPGPLFQMKPAMETIRQSMYEAVHLRFK